MPIPDQFFDEPRRVGLRSWRCLFATILLLFSCCCVALCSDQPDPKIIGRTPGSPGDGGPSVGVVADDLTVRFTCPTGDCGDDELAGLPPNGNDANCQVGGVDIFSPPQQYLWVDSGSGRRPSVW
jgi:hypothetical protein